MKIVIPKNIFAAVFALTLKEEYKKNISVESTSLISRELEAGKADIALIPSLDLINHKDFFVSKDIGISFDGALSNSYIYFVPEQLSFKKIFLKGDVSTNEIILSKILFKERFGADVEVTLDTEKARFGKRNYIISGNENYSEGYYEKGVSFSDQIAALIDLPYVNYLVASKDAEKLKKFTSEFGELDKKVEDNIEEYLNKIDFSPEVTSFIKRNLNTIYFEITNNELDALDELLRIPFYHGIIENILNVKAV